MTWRREYAHDIVFSVSYYPPFRSWPLSLTPQYIDQEADWKRRGERLNPACFITNSTREWNNKVWNNSKDSKYSYESCKKTQLTLLNTETFVSWIIKFSTSNSLNFWKPDAISNLRLNIFCWYRYFLNIISIFVDLSFSKSLFNTCFLFDFKVI